MKLGAAAILLGLGAAASFALPDLARADGSYPYHAAHASRHHHGSRVAGRGWHYQGGHWVWQLPVAIGSPMGGMPLVYYGGGYLPGYGAAFPFYSGGYDPGYGCSMEYHFENGFCYPN